MRKIISLLLLLTLLFALAACSGSTLGTSHTLQTITTGSNAGTSVDASQSSSGVSNPISVDYDSDDLDTSATGDNPATITLEGNTISFVGAGASVNGSVIIITYAGVYTVSGSLDDGQIIVDTESAETVHLILNGVSISSSTSAPIYIRNAEKVVITLANGTQNYVTDGTAYILESGSDEPNAAVFSKSDLTLNGDGALTVSANYDNGITGKDDLKIVSGNISINAVNDAIRGRDSISIQDGTFTITAGGNGLQSNNDEDSAKGWVSISGGTFNITVNQDGIQAETSLAISGGDFTITTGGGSIKGTHVGQGDWGMGNNSNTSDSNVSAKGLKAGVDLTVTGGIFTIDSADDTLHSNNSLAINGGTFQLASGDDGIHSDTTLTINSGELTITQSYEGIESQTITINNGTIHLTASDDGINGSSGSSSTDGVFQRQGDMGASNSNMYIHGGYIYVDANGDGIDVNGPMEMTGGIVIVNGPTNNGNGPLDYTGTFKMTGGFLVAAGSSGMAQAPTETSTQYSLLYAFDVQQAAGTIVHIQTSSGEEVLTFVPTKMYQSVTLSSPYLVNGSTYVIFTGGTVTGTATDGLYSGESYSSGTQVASLTLSGITTIAGSAGGGFPGGQGGGPAGGGGRPKP
jgi:hypothetical protein